MSEDNLINKEDQIIIRAINIDNDEVICEGYNGDDVMAEAEKSGVDYIIDFDTNSNYSFIFWIRLFTLLKK